MAALSTAGVGLLAWHRRRATSAAVSLSVTMAASAGWCLGDLAVLLSSSGLAPEVVGRHAFRWTFSMGPVLVAAFVTMTRAVADRTWRPTRRLLTLLAVEPALMIAGVAGPWSDAVFTVGPAPDGAVWPAWQFGWLFWLHTGYSYVLLSWIFVELIRVWRHGSPLQRRQLAPLIAAGIFPLLANLVAVSSPPGAVPDTTGLGFAVTALIDGYAVLRLGLMQLVPIARRLVLDGMRDGVLVLDPEGRLLDANRAGAGLLRALAPDLPTVLTGIGAAEILVRGMGGEPIADGERSLVLRGGSGVVDVRVEELDDGRGHPIGRVVVIRDVTELHRLRMQLAELAVRDELTGLHNRRHLMAILDRELAHALRGPADLCVVLIDIDHFKSVNDEHGHSVGDALLAATSRALSSVLRTGDTLARYGGEEFVALLPGATQEQALNRAQELRRRCAEVRVEGPGGTVCRTASFGVASARALAARTDVRQVTPAALLQAADEALYRAKAGGRDQVVAA